ncbi:hypothetical protein INS49_005459 [Diaporthe citri]|uniref:uncharacterized protein n=1 Tax=Diaporthe citri TaxID=83186 RepID=UPI001C80B5FD|nr:uncharacterized protein INS49_005459 [Diaporthe citri]KAG6353750.1 hypothetical protein INS49_005459 [Diaporthe citri]
MNSITAPLIADLFLLAILAIGRDEVKAGTLGDNGIFPIDIMIFFITLAYIAISIDASGLIRGIADEEEKTHGNDDQGQLLSLVEIMNPFLDKGGAAFGAIIMSVTLVTIVAVNAASVKTKNDEQFQVFWVTLPAAFVMLCWDIAFGWLHREETREISRRGREEVERVRLDRLSREKRNREQGEGRQVSNEGGTEMLLITRSSSKQPRAWPETKVEDADADAKPEQNASPVVPGGGSPPLLTLTPAGPAGDASISPAPESSSPLELSGSTGEGMAADNTRSSSDGLTIFDKRESPLCADGSTVSAQGILTSSLNTPTNEKQPSEPVESTVQTAMEHDPVTLVSLYKDGYRWSQETFPTVMAVISHLPFALVPFAFSMFVLVQALVTKGWVSVFAHGWDHWVEKTGTIGAVGGMGFLSVILCNFAGTNIGTTILLSRVIQAWQRIHLEPNSNHISDRTFWATVYSMALGVNYGAFSTAFSASLAGLLWRDILQRKHIHIRRMEFARVNVPIIAIAMTVGCTVLVGEIYIIRKETPYSL